MPKDSYEDQPAFGISKSTQGPLIGLIVVSITALVVVLVVLARDK